jgi:hypothetical protein
VTAVTRDEPGMADDDRPAETAAADRAEAGPAAAGRAGAGEPAAGNDAGQVNGAGGPATVSVPEPRTESIPGETSRPDETVLNGQVARTGPAEVAARRPAPPPVLDQPSWGTVLSNTVRLWLQRHGSSGRSGSERSGSRWRPMALLGLAIVIFAAGAITVALMGRTSAPPSPRSGPSSPGSGDNSGPAAVARNQAAAWITDQVSHGSSVACDPVMCQVLAQHHFPSGSLVQISQQSTDPLGSAVVVATSVLRNQFGSRLTGEYAPVSIASFGAGSAQITVLVTATDGATKYRSDLKADQAARRASGQELLGNSRVVTTPAARAAIASGQVDSRLLLSLAALAAQGPQVRIYSFSQVTPGADPGVPLRGMDLAAPPGTDARSYLAAAESLLRAQRAPYLASDIGITTLPTGRTVLHVQFAAPSPLKIIGTQNLGKPTSQKN